MAMWMCRQRSSPAALALRTGSPAVRAPVIAVSGVAVADTLPGRSGLVDGFGMIVLAMIGSAVSVLAAATVDDRLRRRTADGTGSGGHAP